MTSPIRPFTSFPHASQPAQSTQSASAAPTASARDDPARRQYLQSILPPHNIWTLLAHAPANPPGAPASPNPHSFIGPSLDLALPPQQPNALSLTQVIETLHRIRMQPIVDAEVQYAHDDHAPTDPQGARRLVYRSVQNQPSRRGLQVTLNIDQANRLSRMVVQLIHNGHVLPQQRQTTLLPLAAERPATPPSPRAAWTQALYQAAAPHGRVRDRSNPTTPTEAPAAQRLRTHADLHQQAGAVGQPSQQPRLERFFMDRLPDFRQAGLQHISPEDLGKNGFKPEAHYDRHTVDGPHYDAWGQPRYYLEHQVGHACAQHAVNAMIGGPFLPLHAFVTHEHDHQPPGMPRRSIRAVAATIDEEGVQSSTVLAVLEEAGIEATSFHPTTATGPAGEPMLDWHQLELIDHLDAERFVLHYSALVEDAHTSAMSVLTSHFVAFRRLPQTQEWCLLDSLEEEPRVVTPSDYLRQRAREVQGPGRSLNDITVIVPQRRLALLGETAGGTGVASGSGTNAGQAARALQTPGAGPSSGAAATGIATATEQPGAARRQLQFETIHNLNNKQHGKGYEIRYKDEHGKVRSKSLFLKKFKGMKEFEEAKKKIIDSINEGTLELRLPKNAPEFPSPRPGVTWEKESSAHKAHWRVEIKGLRKNVYLHLYNDDVKAASDAAVKLAEDIEANPGKYATKRRAAQQSLVMGVTWDSASDRWRFRPKGSSKFSYFVPNAETTIKAARIQAERFALSQGARPHLRRVEQYAHDLRNVPPITWNADDTAFVVNHDGQTEPFPIAAYADDIYVDAMLEARTAAENRATEIARQQAQDPAQEQEAGPSRARGKRGARKR